MLPCTQLMIAKSGESADTWLPLPVHASDTASVASYLTEYFFPKSFYQTCDLDSAVFRQTVKFLSYVHDIGKATALFQSKIAVSVPDCRVRIEQYGLQIPDISSYLSPGQTPHSLAGEVILRKLKCPPSVAAVVGAHHGAPTELTKIRNQAMGDSFIENYIGSGSASNRVIWEEIWSDLLAYALAQSGLASVQELPELSVQAQILLNGLLIMADWIASNTAFFPLIPIEETAMDISMPQRIQRAVALIAFPHTWESVQTLYSFGHFRDGFGFSPNSVQDTFLKTVSSCETPGLFILEAPMGCGKTEAALAAAEILAAKCKKNGIFFGLPSQATANGIFPRLIEWTERQSDEEYHSIRLVHGASALNERFMQIRRSIPDSYSSDESESGLIAHSWFGGSKQACLDQFVIGTVDHLLMMALCRKHLMLLHLGLAQKVAIIDECHAYDTYMNQYLECALSWLGAYHTPVILLSATLPAGRRAKLTAAYLNAKRIDDTVESESGYPLLTWTDGQTIHTEQLPATHLSQRNIRTATLCMEALCGTVTDALQCGGCVGIIANTVKRAQQIAAILRDECDADIILYHAQFIQSDRNMLEDRILRRVGKRSTEDMRKNTVIVGTQVLEQSLDIDFDILITELCPMDLLLQRIGRLHRHPERKRPAALQEAVCCILQSDDNSGSEKIYGKWLLGQTAARLPERILIPDQISTLVQAVYQAEAPDDADYQEYKRIQQEKRSHAKGYLLKRPNSLKFHHMLDRAVDSDAEAEASVRDGISSVEVLVLMRRQDGTLRLLPWHTQTQPLPADCVPDDEICRTIAAQKLRLPAALCQRYNIKITISELTRQFGSVMKIWDRSPLLHGQLLLILDERLRSALGEFHLTYSRENGLQYTTEVFDHG